MSLCPNAVSSGAAPADALQIQCFQCEETQLDCSAPADVVNCTANVQDTCQKEVLVRAEGPSSPADASGFAATFVLMDVSVSWCRRPLSEVVRVLGGVSYRLLWLPAVLHRPAGLGLHLLLQHAAVQRAPEEAARPIRSGSAQRADTPPDAPPPPGGLRHAPPPDVDRISETPQRILWLGLDLRLMRLAKP